MPVVKPILRIFDYAKAEEFYMHWLGFRVDWVYEQEGLPVYLQVSMGDIVLPGSLSTTIPTCAPTISN
jgi:catechol 2,3-dioxygenase-like lactoylglutathione lyase family enzyme